MRLGEEGRKIDGGEGGGRMGRIGEDRSEEEEYSIICIIYNIIIV